MAEFDLTVVGAGPGGYVAAIRAAQLGKKVMIIEENELGGICLNWGCIPTKSLLRSSELFVSINEAQKYGLIVKSSSYDINNIVARSRNSAATLSKGISFLLKKNNISFVKGKAQLTSFNKIDVIIKNKEKIEISASNIIIATGARPKKFLGFEYGKNKNIWNYKDAMTVNKIPKSLIIIGSGAIGIEFASFFSSLGTKVKVIEAMDNILPNEDHEISEMLEKILSKKEVMFFKSSKVKDIITSKKSIKVKFDCLSSEQFEEAENVLIAVGIKGNTEDLGIEKLGISIKNDHILTDNFGYTGIKNIYAIGDVSGPPWLAHKASHEGVRCVEKIFEVSQFKGENSLKFKENIPSCVYSNPQIASVGLTEKQAKKNGYDIKIGKFPFKGNGKAITLGEEEGIVKTIFNSKTGELLGAHLIGVDVTELIHGFVLAINLEATELDLINSIFPHPTLSEMIHESVLNAYERSIHI